jgi:hypothetical protein
MRRADVAKRRGDPFIWPEFIERLLLKHDVAEHIAESPAKNLGGPDFPITVQLVKFQQFSEQLIDSEVMF